MTLRILHVDSGREWRGGQRQVLLLARAQRDRGHEPLVVAHSDTPLLHRLRAGGLAASAIRMRADWDLAAARRLRALIRAWHPDIVHAHDARAHALAMTALLGRGTPPLVVTRRVANIPRGRVKYGPRVARFIAISNAVREALIKGGVPDSRIDIVHSGVPTPSVSDPRDWRGEREWPENVVVCGIVGAMTAEKGISRLAEIAAQLPADVRPIIRLVLLGGRAAGPEDIGRLMAFRAGFVDEIHRAMAGLDLLWHPSSAEGLGTSLIDSMALRVPPIAFNVGGIPELVIDGVSGLLAPAGDVGAFAAHVARLVRDRPLRQQMADAGVVRAAEFNVDRMAVGTEATYEQVLRTF